MQLVASEAPFRFRNLSRPGIVHGVTGQTPDLPGEGDISYVTGRSADEVRQARSAWAAAIGVDPDAITTCRQTHGTNVQAVIASHAGRGAESHGDGFPDTDALITDVPGVAIMTVAADCVPILLYDPVKQVVGAVHAGWRGTVRGIGMKVVEAMSREYGCNPSDVLAGLGPSIGPCCYEVGPEVIEAWDELGVDPGRESVVPGPRREHLDLWQANELVLISAGVRLEHIERSGLCTRCNADRYFSRRAGVGHRGLFGAIIALEEPGQ